MSERTPEEMRDYQRARRARHRAILGSAAPEAPTTPTGAAAPVQDGSAAAAGDASFRALRALQWEPIIKAMSQAERDALLAALNHAR